MKLFTIFDLDGVLVDNIAYERAVTEHIVRAISFSRMLSFEEALSLWNKTLAAHAQDPRWHDYSVHCAALGVPDVWQSSHRDMGHLIRQMPRAAEAMAIAHLAGSCWLASDATSWVALFKLHAAGFDLQEFEEIFTLDRCGVGKGHPGFWACLAGCIGDSNAATIYVDNRLDRLIAATSILPNCRMVHIAAEDHPSSLGLFPEPVLSEQMHVCRVTHERLPEALQSIARELKAMK